MQTGGARDRTADLLISCQHALPPEPSSVHRYPTICYCIVSISLGDIYKNSCGVSAAPWAFYTIIKPQKPPSGARLRAHQHSGWSLHPSTDMETLTLCSDCTVRARPQIVFFIVPRWETTDDALTFFFFFFFLLPSTANSTCLLTNRSTEHCLNMAERKRNEV